MLSFLLSVALLLSSSACRRDNDPQRLRPRQLRDVPAARLAFTFQADIERPAAAETPARIAAIDKDFELNRKPDALLRTVLSPDKQRALALYGAADEQADFFRIDLYSADGKFLRNLTPPELAVVSEDSVSWSSDGGFIAFVGHKNVKPEPSPTPEGLESGLPTASPLPTPVLPSFAPVAVFNTEQVYVCNRDGYDLRPMTRRDGLIYFALSWAPDAHALAALACTESELAARLKELKTPAGRPRLIFIDGTERLLDDALAEAAPVWSPDSSKVATSFGFEIGIYDAASKAPTQARISLRDRLLSASIAYDEKVQGGKKRAENSGAGNTPFTFLPIVTLEWPLAEKLYLETAYVSEGNPPIKTFSRWHSVVLTPQAAILGR